MVRPRQSRHGAALQESVANSADERARASVTASTGDAEGAAKKRVSLTPLRAIVPYLLRYRNRLALAFLALVASALAMLAVPMAVRRMIDFGFSGSDGGLHRPLLPDADRASAWCWRWPARARFYLVNWLGERVVADLRADVFRHLALLGPAFFETHALGRDHEPADRRHDADQGGGRHGAQPGAAQCRSCWSARSS